MTQLRIIKRSVSSINLDLDLNPSAFRYFVGNVEMKRDVIKSGLKPAFLGMLDMLILPNPSDFQELSNWTFSSPLEALAGTGGNTETINTYDGIKYAYRSSIETQLTPLIPANLNGFAGKTFKSVFQMTGAIYIETSDLNEVTHAEFIDTENGFDPEIVPLAVVGGTARKLATFNTTPSGYFPVEVGQTPTHGKDGFAFRPLSYWDEIVIQPGPQGEYTGLITEEKSGFKLDSKLINFNLTATGEALSRYNPIDLFTFAELIKLHYNYRENATFEGDL